MRDDSPRWEEVNPSNFPHERDGLRELASYLPDAHPYHVWANVEFVGTDGSINEVDALVLTRSGLYVVELKHWQGVIEGSGTHWTRQLPNGRTFPEDNPYILANRKAKRLASLIRHYAPRNAQVPYVGAVVLLHARNTRSNLDPIGRQHVYGLDGNEATSRLPSLKKLLLDPPQNPRHHIDAARGRQIVDLVRGAKLRPSVRDRKINQLVLKDTRPVAEGLGWQDFLAEHTVNASVVRRVRFYLTSRAAEDEIPGIRKAAEREFRLLQGIHHPGIARAVDLAEHAWGPAVIFDHQPGWVRLDQWLIERGGRLQLAQRLQLLQDLAEIIDYAHARRLAHRSLHPRAIFVDRPEAARPSLVVTDWQTGTRTAATSLTQLGSSTDPATLTMFFDDEVRRYQAPEAANMTRSLGHQLDVFSLGVLAYRIFADREAAPTPEALLAAVTGGGLHLDAAADGMPKSLVDLVYGATHGDPAQRLPSVAEFRGRLEDVWEELTAPEPEPVVDPLSAHKGDVLDGGLTVVARLGSGATATALLVTRPDVDGKPVVLKVARDEQHRERFAAEAATLDKIRDWRVAALVAGPIVVGGRTALLMESAGERTLAEELRGGRLALELLERYGRDLLEIVAVLDGYGVWHRDIKPANLAARARPSDKQQHLCVFDFSLSVTPADQLSAGTVTYLDPFLGPPRRLRYDAAAERFAAAVTLYEMATGTLPRWGDNANPAVISDEVSLDPTSFDPAVADRMVGFFARALARDDAARFDTVDEMTDAWRAIFREIPDPEETSGQPGGRVEALHRDSPLEVAGLTARARSALERRGVHTVGQLLDANQSELIRARGVPDATRKEILAQARSLRAELAVIESRVAEQGGTAGSVTGDAAGTAGIEELCAALLPAETSRSRTQRTTLRVLLGQATGDGDSYLHWPTQGEAAARVAGQSQPQVSTLLRRQIGKWLTDLTVEAVRNEIVTLLDGRGAVMSSVELADALIVAHGSLSAEPKRTAQAIGLVRAAVEAELARGGDARLAVQRFRKTDLVLVGREPEDVSGEVTAADSLGYVVRLGQLAATLAKADPLPTRQRAIEQLRTLDPPVLMPPLPDARLLQLAAAGSNGEADVNVQGQLYPVGMPAARALRLAAGGLIGQSLTVDELRKRVRSRFPRAEELPGRPRLDEVLAECEVPLVWLPTQGHYGRPESGMTVGGGTRMTSTVAPILGPDAPAEAHAKLVGAIERRGFLVVKTSMRRLTAARRALLSRLSLTEVDVTAILLDRLRALGYPWEAIVAADNGSPADADFRSLVDLVRHEVVPAIGDALAAADGPALLTEAAPLARYGQMRVVQELADSTRPRPAARLLLVPVRRPEAAQLDGEPIPLVSPASQALWLPDTWLTPPSLPASPEGRAL